MGTITSEQFQDLSEKVKDLTKKVSDQASLITQLKKQVAALFEAPARLPHKADADPVLNSPLLPKEAFFTYEQKKYQVLYPQVEIPGIGIRTAEELLHDRAAQEKLVKLNSGAIREVL